MQCIKNFTFCENFLYIESPASWRIRFGMREEQLKYFVISILAWYFWQNIHAVDTRGNSKTTFFLPHFYAQHRSLAAYPLFFALCDLGRQNQHHFQLAALPDSGVGVQEYPACAQIAGDASGCNLPARRLNRNRHLHRSALTRSTLVLILCHGSGERITTGPGERKWVKDKRSKIQR
jgi:hypothetical protein